MERGEPSYEPAKVTPKAQQLINSKELQASLPKGEVRVHDPTIRKRLSKNGLHGSISR